MASSQIPIDHLRQYSDMAVTWMQQYLRIDTTNPPGHEMRAVDFYKNILDLEGIENIPFEYSPGRGDLWARIPHTVEPAKRPLILLNHMDVVTSDPSHWKIPPFSGEMEDGWLWGRGAQDMKDEGLAQLLVMVMLKREKVPLDRDVIFLAVADEEAEGIGTDWFISHQRDLLENAEFLINEGGENLLDDGKVRYIGVDVGEKTTFWLHVVAHGRAGHASRPIPDSAPDRLVHALDRILAYRTPLRVLPVVEEFLREMAPYEPPDEASEYRNIRKAIEDKKFQQDVEKDESLNFLLRDTISLTMMGGSEQTNVIPPETWANLDVRICPEGTQKRFSRKFAESSMTPTSPSNQSTGNFAAPITRQPIPPCMTTFARFRRNTSRERLLSLTSPADTRRTSVIDRWASTPMDLIPTRLPKKKATANTGTMNASAWKRSGAGLGFCSMSSPLSRARNEILIRSQIRNIDRAVR